MVFSSIRVRYSTIFCSLALFVLISALMNFRLIGAAEDGLFRFGDQYNPAISAVLNADRDLYQANVAGLSALLNPENDSLVRQQRSDFEDNAQQAYQRFNKFKQLLGNDRKLFVKLNNFEQHFNLWHRQADSVFSLILAGDVEQAKMISDERVTEAFNKLRADYNMAGELVDSLSSQDSQDTIESVDNMQLLLMILSGIVIVLMLFTGIAAPKAMSDALNDLASKLKDLNSDDGDFTKRINSERRDEIGDVANALDDFIDSLSGLIESIACQSTQVIDGVGELDSGAKNICNTSEKQLESAELIVTAVNEMSYAITEVSQNAQLTSTEIIEVNRLADEGTKITNNAVSEIKGLSHAVQEASHAITKLSDNSKDISSVLDVIRGIAEQTNLLALNAAIEAARAGEQGRGFAVVADEVRNLASKTQQSTENIQLMIESLHKGVAEAIDSIEKGSQATHSSVDLSEQTLTALENISNASKRVSDVAAHTARSTDEQRVVAEDVSKHLTIMSEQTQNNHQVSLSNSDLSHTTMDMAQALNSSVTTFKFS